MYVWEVLTGLAKGIVVGLGQTTSRTGVLESIAEREDEAPKMGNAEVDPRIDSLDSMIEGKESP